MLMPASYFAAALFMMLTTRLSGNAGYSLSRAYEVAGRMTKKSNFYKSSSAIFVSYSVNF
jgi:hypothetical protein